MEHEHWHAEINQLRAVRAAPPKPKQLTLAQRAAQEAEQANREQRLAYQCQIELERWGGRPWRDAPV